jgi:phosphonate transport system substrate-binding protein
MFSKIIKTGAVSIVFGSLLFLSSVSRGEDKVELTFAMLPQISNVLVYDKWKPILDFVEKEAGVKFTQVYPKDFDTHVKLCQEGKVDFAYSNPITYAKMAPKQGVRSDGHIAFALAKTSQGTRDMSGVFIARKDNAAIKSFKDIKGKKGWIVGYTSAGGYVFEQAYALDKGIDLTKDCTLTESPGNKQEKVIMAVYLKETDFGCIRNNMLNVLKDKIDLGQIKILAETSKHCSWVVSMHSKVDPAVAERVRKAFLKVPDELVSSSKLPGDVVGFSGAKDGDLNAIRKVMDKTKMDY